MLSPKNAFSSSRVTSFQAPPSVPAALFLCAFRFVIVNNKFHTWWSKNSSKYSRALACLLSPRLVGPTALVNCFKFLLVFSSDQTYCWPPSDSGSSVSSPPTSGSRYPLTSSSTTGTANGFSELSRPVLSLFSHIFATIYLTFTRRLAFFIR